MSISLTCSMILKANPHAKNEDDEEDDNTANAMMAAVKVIMTSSDL